MHRCLRWSTLDTVFRRGFFGFAMSQRKIIHVDMDAFYASVEQRDDPALRGKPVVVAWRGARSVVCAASLRGAQVRRAFGDAGGACRALVPGRGVRAAGFCALQAVSRQIREIFLRHTPSGGTAVTGRGVSGCHRRSQRLAFGDRHRRNHAFAPRFARKPQLTASAGVAPNKFLAKIASDWNKPDGLYVVQAAMRCWISSRHFADRALARRGQGDGSQARPRWASATVGDLRLRPLAELESRFGRYGRRLHELALGIDPHPVVPNRPTQSISAEDTLADDLPLANLEPMIRELADKVWAATRKETRVGHTVVLKLKTREFRILTRSLTPVEMPSSAQALAELALALRERVQLPQGTRYRLVGVGIGNFRDAETADAQPSLFEG
jgi:DNA polymerase-4